MVGGLSIIVLGFSGVDHWNGGLAYLGGEEMTNVAIGFNHWMAQTQITWAPTAVIMACLIFSGISNGLLSSPVVTHINKTSVAQRQGVKSVTATYTFLERGGHVLGPMLIGYSLSLGGNSNIPLSLFGVVLTAAGIVFILVSKKI